MNNTKNQSFTQRRNSELMRALAHRDFRIEKMMKRIIELEKTVNELRPKPITNRERIEDLIHDVVTKYHPYDMDQLRSKSRLREIVVSRQIHQYFLHKFTTYTLKQIGELFGGRDHSTVIHSIQAVRDLSYYDKRYAEELAEMNQYIINLIK